ncbi:hypothetical protein HAX54_042381 [Datura stramonium]|uniref:Uncharacterized protein n=1 Tax=Datura stramonium TaxID=4076 RepID=A0ABS8W332_DATST|nr:hypothetical protein [Datura stramonium]
MIDGVTSFLREVIEYMAMTSTRKNSDRHAQKATSSNKGKDKGKDTTVPVNAEERLRFCVKGMKPYFIKDWLSFFDAPGGYHPNLVLELYATYQVRQDSMKYSGRVDEFPCLPFVTEEQIAPEIVFVEKIAIKSQQLQWVADIIEDVPKSSLAHDTDGSSLEQDLDDPTPMMFGHASEDVPPPRSSPPPPTSGPSGLQKLVDMTYANDNQLTKLAKNLSALIQRVDVIERAITLLPTDVKVIKGKASLTSVDMSFLDEVMVAQHIAQGPIDDFLGSIEKDEESEP